jgi:periplasmic copper chaperone A
MRIERRWILMAILVVALAVLIVPISRSSPSATVQPSSGLSIAITDVSARILLADTRYLSVSATITNRGSDDVRLVGASSPAAKSGGLYMSSACSIVPGSPGASTRPGLAGKARMDGGWWLIRAGESVSLRSGAGEILLVGLDAALAEGSPVLVDFEFQNLGSLPVTAFIAGDAATVAGGWGCGA